MERENKHVKYRVTTTELRYLTEKGWEVPRMALGRHPTKGVCRGGGGRRGKGSPQHDLFDLNVENMLDLDENNPR